MGKDPVCSGDNNEGTEMSIEVRTVTAGNVSMKYFCFGRGKKNFVMLPGLSIIPVSVTAQAVAGAYSVFEEDYTVWVFDRREDVPRGYTVTDMAHETAECIRALGITDAYVFGASQGGVMAQYMAEHEQDLVKCAAIASSPSRSSAIGEDSGVAEWLRLAAKGDAEALCTSFAERLYTGEELDGVRDAFRTLARMVTDKDLERFVRLGESLADFNTYDDLDRVKCPLYVAAGGNDRVLSADAVTEAAYKTGCELYVFKDCGHAVYDEAPDFKDRLKAFFDRY